MAKILTEDLSERAEALISRIRSREARIGIIGLGYVGLPLLWTLHKNGYPVLGLDIDENKIECFRTGTSYIRHYDSDLMGALAASDKCEATSDFGRSAECDVLLLCVPTPLSIHRDPDLSYVESTLRSVGPYLREGQLLVLESTTYPGTTEEIVVPICEELSGLRSGQDLFVAYSPEREDPGNPEFATHSIPKVVGGEGSDALAIAIELYESIVVSVIPVTDTKTAEAVKLHENIFRAANIALVNELKMVYRSMGIDIYEVIEAAKTKPFGFMPFYPGPGLGGHCIPIDPFYLTWKAKEFGLHTRFIELAGEINSSMPDFVVGRCVEALNDQQKTVNGSSVLCVGLAYKPNVDDDRESPSYAVMDRLKKLGADVSYYDPHIPVIRPSREHSEWAGTQSIEWTRENIESFDLVVVLTHHESLDGDAIAEWSQCVVDTRNVLGGWRERSNIWRA